MGHPPRRTRPVSALSGGGGYRAPSPAGSGWGGARGSPPDALRPVPRRCGALGLATTTTTHLTRMAWWALTPSSSTCILCDGLQWPRAPAGPRRGPGCGRDDAGGPLPDHQPEPLPLQPLLLGREGPRALYHLSLRALRGPRSWPTLTPPHCLTAPQHHQGLLRPPLVQAILPPYGWAGGPTTA